MSTAFGYIPVRLAAAAAQLEEKFGRGGAALLERLISPFRLQELLEVLQGLSEGKPLQDWAEQLGRRDLLTLARFFPSEVPEPLRWRVTMVLHHRFSPELAALVWRHFRNDPDKARVLDMVSYLFLNHDPALWKDQFPAAALPTLRAVFGRSDPLAHLAREVRSRSPFAGAFSALGISWPCRAADLIANAALRDADGTVLLRVQEEGFLQPWLAAWEEKERERAGAILERYLLQIPLSRYHEPLLSHFLRRWGDPLTPTPPWTRIRSEALQRLQRWLNERQLSELLDNERFQFWRGYLDRAEGRVEWLGDKEVVILRFAQVAVVEFTAVGNACFVYRRQEFDRFPLARFPRGRRLSTWEKQDLKRIEPLLLRQIHQHGWQKRVAEEMAPYIGWPAFDRS